MTDIVNVRLPRRLRKTLGKKDWPVIVNGETTLEGILHRLADECHPSFNDLLRGEAQGARRLESIILNGRTVVLPNDLQLPVKGGDRLSFFELIGGG